MAADGLREMIQEVTGWLCSPHEGSRDLAAATTLVIGVERPELCAMDDCNGPICTTGLPGR